MAQFKIKRRDSRVEIALPVLLTVTEAKGSSVEQQVTTIDVSRQGALVQGFLGSIRMGRTVSLTRLNKTHEFRVAWVGAKDTPTAGQLGLSAVDPNSSFWDDVLEATGPPRVEPLRSAPMRSMAAHGA
jgi:hypothetical protein